MAEGSHPRVLLVERDAAAAARLVALVEEAWPGAAVPPTVVHGLTDARRAIAACEFDCIVLGLECPDALGLTSVEVLRVAVPDVPLVVLGSQLADLVVLATFEAGADDVLSRLDLSVEEFRRAVIGAITRVSAGRRAAAVQVDRLLLGAVGLPTMVIDGRGRISACNDEWGRVAPRSAWARTTWRPAIATPVRRRRPASGPSSVATSRRSAASSATRIAGTSCERFPSGPLVVGRS